MPLPAQNKKISQSPQYRKALKGQIEEMKKGLPHLYGWKWYQWAFDFFQSRNRINCLVAANQISKSSTLIRKNIEWACNKKLWKELWPKREPKIFWYFYPTIDVATLEFTKKWVPEFLPKGLMKEHEWYGWEAEFSAGDIHALHFKSGVSIYFKTYGQKAINLQTTTVDMISGDEEMPEELIDECFGRLVATEGYFNTVFTATIGQPIWYRAMECIGSVEEAFRHAFKRTVSMYDCQLYMDGSEGAWPLARIKEREKMCTSENERLRRVMGRFVKDEGRRYAAFDPTKNLISKDEPVPKDWRYYAGVDIGSGGGSAHRSCGAIVIVGVNPDYTRGRVVRSWRGDYEETTAGDILQKYLMLRKGIVITQAVYDHGSREFGMIAQRLGVPFLPADKSNQSGEQTMNSLFRARALLIDDGAYDNPKLVTELATVPENKAAHRKIRDDLCDAMRYTIKLVPWDFGKIGVGFDDTDLDADPLLTIADPTTSEFRDVRWTAQQLHTWQTRERRGQIKPSNRDQTWQDITDQIDIWNEEYG